MLLKIAYLLFALTLDLLIYFKLYKKDWLDNNKFTRICVVLIIFILLHLFNLSFLWRLDAVIPIVFMGLAPILFFLFFHYRVIEGIKRDTIEQNKSFNAFALKFFSFFFLKLGFAMPMIVQILFILSQ